MAKVKSGFVFKEVLTDKEKKDYRLRHYFRNQKKVPIKVFYLNTVVGLILVNPTIQIQVKGVKQDVKPKSIQAAKKFFKDNEHLFTT